MMGFFSDWLQTSVQRTALLTLAVPAAIVVWTPAAAQESQESMVVQAVVRDFRKADPNFVVTPSGGNGHYVGNLAMTLGDNGCPIYSGAGFRVNTQWRNVANQPIPPHLYALGGLGGLVSLVTSPTITGNGIVDSYNSALGPYGGTNVGPAATWVPDSTMPVLNPPTGLPPLVPSVTYGGNTSTDLTDDINCSEFNLRNSHELRINGNRTIWVHDVCLIENYSEITFQPNATLKLYFSGSCMLDNHIKANLNGSPSRLTIINLGTQEIFMNNNAQVCATIITPFAPLHMTENANFYGTFIGESVILENSSGFHNDSSPNPPPAICGGPLSDTPGTAGMASNGGIPSEAALATWFNDLLGTNLSRTLNIELVKNSSGVYQYSNNEFYPIDGQLFGNEGEDHNHYFTLTIELQFIHHACEGDGTFFEFYGADDAWLFIDGQLAMDLGGVMPATSQRVEIDRLTSLQDGQTYTMKFFYAQRQPVMAMFNVSTNLDLLDSPMLATISAGCD
ncbi:MAG: fibro-slime domain-containing protein [Phycisphaerales bacterium]|nr:fibro-slime domain-containing protein [Phycisphaerales bacterium]